MKVYNTTCLFSSFGSFMVSTEWSHEFKPNW